MKNIIELPESTPEEIREKLHCYFSEKHEIGRFMNLLEARSKEIDKILVGLIDKSAKETLRKHGIKPVKLSLG